MKEIKADATKRQLSDPNSNKPPAKAQAENQPEKQKDLSGFEILGLIIFAGLAFLWLLWQCGLPPRVAMDWADWFFHGCGFRGYSPMYLLYFLGALWWLLVLRHNKH